MKRREFHQGDRHWRGGAATLAAPAIAQSMPEIKWRLTSSLPKSLDTLYGGAELFAKAVAEATDNKFQIQTFAAGEIVPGLQVLDAVQNGTVEMGHTASLLLLRQGSDVRVRHVAAVRAERAASDRRGACSAAARSCCNEFYKSYNVIVVAGRQHRLPDGRLVSQGDQDRRRSEGLKMRIGGFAGPRDAEARRRAAAARPAATSIPRWKKARSTRRNGSVPTTTRSSASTRSRKYYYYPGWWEGGRCCWR